MNDHNLDDLIIDNMEPKNSKTKSFLTIIALLIVVLIVAIILTKIVLKDPNKENSAFEENTSELISPELTLQSVTESKSEKKEPVLSNIIETEPQAPVQTKKVSQKTTEAKQEAVQTPTKPIIETKVQKEVSAPKVPKKQEKITPKEPEKKIIEKTPVKAEKLLPSKSIEKTKEEARKNLVNSATFTKPVAVQTFYIQVGSFQKTPSTRFLSIIKNSGFNYKITSPTANGTKKLLIGPYKNRTDADTALIRVRDRINKSAFIIKK
ncbi:MAG: hypothetical protein P794_00145 [Epsilonproteobacteria bacterium (ex Lamellibrachia satsuma)]|nr:MAG: hypothetical protein P794_00145 [Epsilonproteobacteria bacterium (ex Lamellibrachia satsuma)]